MMTPFTVCIPAAGSGTRMNSAIPKQYLRLLGTPVLLHVLTLFARMDTCDRIIVATDDDTRLRELLAEGQLETAVDIVPGGARRQDSVAQAITAVSDDDAIVLVHDAARPCVEQRHVQDTADTAARHGVAVLAVPARDTLKEVHDGRIMRTLDRSVIWQAQTPQAARAAVFREAFRHADKTGITATDDVALIEALGQPVHVVEGSHDNIKITQPGDLDIAAAILRRQGRA